MREVRLPSKDVMLSQQVFHLSSQGELRYNLRCLVKHKLIYKTHVHTQSFKSGACFNDSEIRENYTACITPQ